MDEPLENLYFNWLCAKVIHIEIPTPSLTFWKLFRTLYSTEFVWLLSGDDNRAEDGLELREEFLFESNIPDDPQWRGTGCSILEMFVAFARRAQFVAGETIQFWFWHFLENLDLIVNDASDTTDQEVEQILYEFVWRNYHPDGRGGLFPMDNPPDNQKTVEVWYQFCEYLVDINWPL